MSRSLHANTQTEIVKPEVTPAFFVEIDYSDPVRVWTGDFTVSWDSKTWLGAGNLIGIGPAGEDLSGGAQAVDLTLSGLNAEILEDIVAADIQGSDVAIWIGFLTSAGALVSNPVKYWGGFVDVPTTDDSDQTLISVRCEPYSILLQRQSHRRWTPDDHKIDNSSDKFFDYVPQMPAVKLLWGKAGQNGPTAPAFGGGYQDIINRIRQQYGFWGF